MNKSRYRLPITCRLTAYVGSNDLNELSPQPHPQEPLCVAIYESAGRVNHSFAFCAAPAGAAVVESRYTTTEPAGDRATLESDLSAAPEAEMGWGARNSLAFRFTDGSLISA